VGGRGEKVAGIMVKFYETVGPSSYQQALAFLSRQSFIMVANDANISLMYSVQDGACSTYVRQHEL
jgi:hypothetical protein